MTLTAFSPSQWMSLRSTMLLVWGIHVNAFGKDRIWKDSLLHANAMFSLLSSCVKENLQAAEILVAILRHSPHFPRLCAACFTHLLILGCKINLRAEDFHFVSRILKSSLQISTQDHFASCPELHLSSTSFTCISPYLVLC